MLATVSDLSHFQCIIDTRSPLEFADDHIPGAINIPALSNAERAMVGRLHQQNHFLARRRGAGLIAANMAEYLRSDLLDQPDYWSPLVYCARGGQRSGSMVEIMRRIGWQACQLAGGYKAYRQYVMEQIERLVGQCSWVVISGKTGVGKTVLLDQLAVTGAAVLDLEALANHRGSVFGSRGVQPSQRRFESLLLVALTTLPHDQPVFVESESRKIGSIHLPNHLLSAMRSANALRLEATLPNRVQYITRAYGSYCEDRVLFQETIKQLRPHTSTTTLSHWQQLHEAGDMTTLVSELLVNFYDVGYNKSLKTNYPAASQSPPIIINPNDTAMIRKATEQVQGCVISNAIMSESRSD